MLNVIKQLNNKYVLELVVPWQFSTMQRQNGIWSPQCITPCKLGILLNIMKILKVVPSREALLAALAWGGLGASNPKGMWAVGRVSPCIFTLRCPEKLNKGCGSRKQGRREHARDKSCHCHPVAILVIACSALPHSFCLRIKWRWDNLSCFLDRK